MQLIEHIILTGVHVVVTHNCHLNFTFETSKIATIFFHAIQTLNRLMKNQETRHSQRNTTLEQGRLAQNCTASLIIDAGHFGRNLRRGVINTITGLERLAAIGTVPVLNPFSVFGNPRVLHEADNLAIGTDRKFRQQIPRFPGTLLSRFGFHAFLFFVVRFLPQKQR